MKQTIYIEEAWKSDEPQLHVRFPYNAEIVNALRKIKGAHWLATGKCWVVPGHAHTRRYLEDVLHDYHLVHTPAPSETEKRKKIISASESSYLHLSEPVQEFRRWLQQRRYSEATVKSYTQCMDYFMRWGNFEDVRTITNLDTDRFLREQIVQRGISTAYQRQIINALKLFFGQCTTTGLNVSLLVLPRKTRQLPKVISKQETELILRACVNQKHRTALLLLYACGLRRSELLKLTLQDVDSSRKVLIVRQSKGNKDRCVPLPDKLIEALRNYYKNYRPRHYLFEGQSGAGTPWSPKSLEQVLHRAVEKSGIQKRVSLHMLRHSYATHQLEAGVNLRYIQEILGHSSPTTTQIYTHVTQDSIRRISSPAESLDVW